MEDQVRHIIDPVLEGMDRELGPEYGAVVYGSVARGEYVAGVSDVNLLIMCESLGPPTLRRLGAILLSLRHQRQPPPLLVDQKEWSRAADVFPIEITDMQLAHFTLRGVDPVAGMRVAPVDLRSSLEQELRGKLLRLRQAYAVHAAEPAALGEVAVHTVSSIAALLRVTLALHGREVPGTTPAALAAIARLGVDAAPVATLWEHRRRTDTPCSPELFEGYLAAVSAAVRVVDQFKGGAT